MSSELNIEHGLAICYSGYRDGQSPTAGIFPSYDQVREDLLILHGKWKYLRLYDCSRHAELVLDVVTREALNFRIMLGANMAAEISNPQCPWGADFENDVLALNASANSEEVDRLIALANRYAEIVFSVSVGNEASVEWTDHLVPVEQLISYVRRIKSQIKQPVTFCENYDPWNYKLDALVAELDFISVHTYPVWEYISIENALEYTKENYRSVTESHPGKPVIITEAGWTTASNGRGILPDNASEELQADYCRQLLDWTNSASILTFVFEAFDEPWKGSPDPDEPEKHWGLFTVDREPKRVMREIYADAPDLAAVSLS
jgi:exo-beta-1,3-glucanase (GH17 family)